MAIGSTATSTKPNSIGGIAVADGRLYDPRTSRLSYGWLAVRPGITMYFAKFRPVKNWVLPRAAIADAPKTMRLSRTSSRSMLRTPSAVSSKMPTQPQIWIIPRSAPFWFRGSILCRFAATYDARKAQKIPRAATRSGCRTLPIGDAGCTQRRRYTMRKIAPIMVDGAPAPPKGGKVYADGMAIRSSTYRVTRETVSRGSDWLFTVTTDLRSVTVTAFTLFAPLLAIYRLAACLRPCSARASAQISSNRSTLFSRSKSSAYPPVVSSPLTKPGGEDKFPPIGPIAKGMPKPTTGEG